MKKIKFKLIPFIISLAIVVGSVTGIMLYSYYQYDNNKLRFVADYFHYEDYKSVETEEQIENFVKMTSYDYQKITDGLTYFDVNSNIDYTSTPSNNSNNFIDGAVFENGVLHLPGYFDLVMYAETNWNANSEKWALSYYVYIYNVNYYAETVVNNLYFCFVNGTGESPEGELYGLTKLDTVIDEVKKGDNGSPNGVNLPTYQYVGETASSYSMYIHDNNATGDYFDEKSIPFVYRLTSLTESPSESSELDDEEDLTKWFSELESSTFSIFYSGASDLSSAIVAGTTDELTEIVRGTYKNQYEDIDDFKAKANEGYGKDLYKGGYFNFIIGRLIVEGLITLVISGVLAALFYLIWQDEPTEEKKAPKKQIKFKKQNKKDA